MLMQQARLRDLPRASGLLLVVIANAYLNFQAQSTLSSTQASIMAPPSGKSRFISSWYTTCGHDKIQNPLPSSSWSLELPRSDLYFPSGMRKLCLLRRFMGRKDAMSILDVCISISRGGSVAGATFQLEAYSLKGICLSRRLSTRA